jgi:hypothetical protein
MVANPVATLSRAVRKSVFHMVVVSFVSGVVIRR